VQLGRVLAGRLERTLHPRDGERILEFGRVLRMNAGAMLEREALDVGGRALAHSATKIEVVAHEDALGSGKAVRGVDDLSDLLVGPRSAPVDLVVFFPEPPLELQTDLAGAVMPDT
jgi:hypothetical protein